MNKKAFTMIELIFVIVILGILAAVAIPKLTATRNDAYNTADCNNIALCVTDLGAEYTSKNSMTINSSLGCTTAQNSSESSIVFTLSDIDSDGINDSIAVTGAPGICTRLNTTTNFGGSAISF